MPATWPRRVGAGRTVYGSVRNVYEYNVVRSPADRGSPGSFKSCQVNHFSARFEVCPAGRSPPDDRSGQACHRCRTPAARRGPRDRQRCPVRLRRRHPRDQRPRPLPAQHHHPAVGLAGGPDRRVRDRTARRRALRRHCAGPAPGDHRHRGRRLRAALRPQHLPHPDHRLQGRRHRPARRGQHHHPATRAQPVPAAGVHARRRLRTVDRAQDQGGPPRRPARKALHEAGDLRALRQPGAAARRLRRRSRRAPLLPEIGARPHGGRSRDDRRHHPGAGAAQPVCEPHPHARAPQQLRAAADGGGRLHHGRAGPGGDEAPGARHGTAARARASRLFRRARPAGTRGSLRRRRHLRNRPAGRHHSRCAVGTGSRNRARPRPSAHRQAAPPLPQAGTQPRAGRHRLTARPARDPSARRHRARRRGATLRRQAAPIRHWSASARGRWSCRAPATRGRGPRRRRSCSRSGTWWRWPSAASRTACPAT